MHQLPNPEGGLKNSFQDTHLLLNGNLRGLVQLSSVPSHVLGNDLHLGFPHTARILQLLLALDAIGGASHQPGHEIQYYMGRQVGAGSAYLSASLLQSMSLETIFS